MAADGSTAKYPPNRRLTWQRLQRGWSREELVRQVKGSMAKQGEPEPGLNTEVVRRWEQGLRWPEPRYRKHLVLLFGATAADLGLLLPDELAVCPDASQAAAPRPGIELTNVTSRKVTFVMHDDALNQHLSPHGLLDSSLAPLQQRQLEVSPATRALGDSHRGSLDPQAVNAYADITDMHRQLYWRTSANDLLPSVAAHAQLGSGMLRANGSEAGSRLLAAAVAESALLTARLAFFDLAEVRLAEQAFDLAQDAVEVAQDHALSAVILGHRAFVPGFAGHAGPAHEYLRAAQLHASYEAGPSLRAWLHCVAAEIDARTGQADASLGNIRAAEDAVASSGDDPIWLDFFSAARLDGFAGNALLLAGQHQAASPRLEAAVEALDDDSAKQRPVLLFDLAVSQAASDAEQAVATARHACDLMTSASYATAMQRLPAVRSALSATPYAAELDARVRELTAATDE